MLKRGWVSAALVLALFGSDAAIGAVSAAAPTISGWSDTLNRKGTDVGVLDTNVTVTDGDSVNFNGGTLTIRMQALAGDLVTPASTVNASDRLTVVHLGDGAGQIGVVGTVVKYAGVQIGTMSATAVTGSTVLTITLNTQATPAAVQALVRRVAYQNTSATTLGVRTVRVQVSDGAVGAGLAGAASLVADKMITLSQVAPLFANLSDITIREYNSSQFYIDTDVTVTDADSTNFDGGSVKVSLPTDATNDQYLSLLNQGTAAGQIGISGTTVSYGGVNIGTWNGVQCVGPVVLQVNLNSSATPAAVSALLRRVVYRNTNLTVPVATTLSRSIKIAVNDGDGGTATAYKSVKLGRSSGAYTGTLVGAVFAGGSTPIDLVCNTTGNLAITLSGISGTGTGTLNTSSRVVSGTSTATIASTAVTVTLTGTAALQTDGSVKASGTWSFVHNGTTYTGKWSAIRPK